MISSDPAPQIILLKSQLNLFEISFLKILDLLSGYFDKIKFLLVKIFFTFELTPSADSFADNLIVFLVLCYI